MLQDTKQAYWTLRERARQIWPWFEARRARSAGQIVAIGGVKVRLHHSYSMRIVQVMVRGHYERAELNLLQKHLEADDRVLELGTGLGLLSAYCAKQVGEQQVLTFEANPQMLRRIEDTFALNAVSPRVENAVLGERAGSITFQISRHFWASSTVRHKSNSHSITVPVRSFSDTIQEFRPTFLIIDIEGGEAELFNHARMDGVQKVLIELHPGLIGEAETRHVQQQIVSQGFQIVDSDKSVVFFRRRVTARRV